MTAAAPSAAATYYKRVDVPSLAFEPVQKEGRLYVSYLQPPLLIQTPPVTMTSGLDGDASHATFAPTAEFAAFLRDVESRVLAVCLDNRESWIKKKVDDDTLRQNFKSFFADGSFRVRVAGDVPVFDARRNLIAGEDVCEGSLVRCVLELTRICFGRQEFGAMWRLVQAQLVEAQPCLVDPAVEAVAGDEEGAGASDDEEGTGDLDEQEFQ